MKLIGFEVDVQVYDHEALLCLWVFADVSGHAATSNADDEAWALASARDAHDWLQTMSVAFTEDFGDQAVEARRVQKAEPTYLLTIALGAVSGVALERAVQLIEKRVRAWIERRRETNAEDWREVEGYF